MGETGSQREPWLERLGVQDFVNRVRAWEVPSDALIWTRFCGSLLTVLVVLLCVTGVFMTFYYSPAPGIAYDSVDYAQFRLPFGVLVRGIHHYAWNLLLVVMGVHLARAFLVGAYMSPREFLWISGVVALLIVPAFIVTGDLLPWDQKGYWSTQVRTSIMASIPVAGDLLVRMLLGGPRTGIVALTRFYVLHVIVLPAVLVAGIAVHFHFLRHRGLAGPISGDQVPREKVPFVPTMLNRWLFLFLTVAAVLGLVAWTARAAGVAGVVIPKDRAAGVTGAVANASAGHVFGVRVARVTNVARACEALKEAGWWLVGLVMGAERTVFELADALDRPALVVGGEGAGIRQLVRAGCDFEATIPMAPGVESLNVSVATGIALYAVTHRAPLASRRWAQIRQVEVGRPRARALRRGVAPLARLLTTGTSMNGGAISTTGEPVHPAVQSISLRGPPPTLARALTVQPVHISVARYEPPSPRFYLSGV